MNWRKWLSGFTAKPKSPQTVTTEYEFEVSDEDIKAFEAWLKHFKRGRYSIEGEEKGKSK
jgi:hypothetical protein